MIALDHIFPLVPHMLASEVSLLRYETKPVGLVCTPTPTLFSTQIYTRFLYSNNSKNIQSLETGVVINENAHQQDTCGT